MLEQRCVIVFNPVSCRKDESQQHHKQKTGRFVSVDTRHRFAAVCQVVTYEILSTALSGILATFYFWVEGVCVVLVQYQAVACFTPPTTVRGEGVDEMFGRELWIRCVENAWTIFSIRADRSGNVPK